MFKEKARIPHISLAYASPRPSISYGRHSLRGVTGKHLVCMPYRVSVTLLGERWIDALV